MYMYVKRLTVRNYLLWLLFSLLTTQVYGGNMPSALDLATAIQQLRDNHPALKVFAVRNQEIAGRKRQADQAPPVHLGFEAEDLAGTGVTNGIDSAEFTLSLSSILQLGGKQAARTAVYGAQQQRLIMQREAEALQRMSQLAQLFISTLTTQERIGLAEESITLNEAAFTIAKRRSSLGAASEIEVLQAEASLAQAKLALTQLHSQLQQQHMQIANQQGLPDVSYQKLAGNIYHFAEALPFEQLYRQASRNPAIEFYASEYQVRQAELALAVSQSSMNINWNIGVRRYEGPDDAALVAGISIPLFTASRNRGNLQAARASAEQVQYDRDSALLELHARLYQAYQQRQASIIQANQLRQHVIPKLERAVQLSRDAYERGRFSYQAWTIAQRDLITARHNLINAASTAQSNQVLIEQLTAVQLTK